MDLQSAAERNGAEARSPHQQLASNASEPRLGLPRSPGVCPPRALIPISGQFFHPSSRKLEMFQRVEMGDALAEIAEETCCLGSDRFASQQLDLYFSSPAHCLGYGARQSSRIFDGMRFSLSKLFHSARQATFYSMAITLHPPSVYAHIIRLLSGLIRSR